MDQTVDAALLMVVHHVSVYLNMKEHHPVYNALYHNTHAIHLLADPTLNALYYQMDIQNVLACLVT